MFNSSEFYGVFLAFMVIFITILLIDYFLKQRKLKYAERSKYAGRSIYESRPSLRFYFKRLIARMLFTLAKRKDIPDDQVDKLQVFDDRDEMPVDAVYFNTSSEDEQILLFATARRKHGLVNTLGMLKVPKFSDKILVLPVFPKSSLYQTKEEQQIQDCYTVSGLKIKSIIPKKEYRIEYNGKMVTNDSIRKEVDVKLCAVWRSNLPTFNFATDSSKVAMSEAMAIEPWTRQYFDNLKSHHQTHLEQFGNLEGVVKIDGKEYPLKSSGMRDHTVGSHRNWNDFHHYCFHFIRLSNGNSISVGVINMPELFSRLLVGFITNAKDNTNIPIDSCSIDLKEFDRQNPPDNYEFDFIANNDSYRVHVETHSQAQVYMGEQMECCFIEKWCNYRVNGVKGWGAVEWQYKTEQNTT